MEELPGESFCSKKNTTARFRFAKLYLSKSQDFWNDVIQTDEMKVEMSGHYAQHHVW